MPDEIQTPSPSETPAGDPRPSRPEPVSLRVRWRRGDVEAEVQVQTDDLQRDFLLLWRVLEPVVVDAGHLGTGVRDLLDLEHEAGSRLLDENIADRQVERREIQLTIDGREEVAGAPIPFDDDEDEGDEDDGD